MFDNIKNLDCLLFSPIVKDDNYHVLFDPDIEDQYDGDNDD